MMSNWEAIESEADPLAARVTEVESRSDDIVRARERVADARKESVDYHNQKNLKRQEDRDFKQGDFVLVRNSSPDNGRLSGGYLLLAIAFNRLRTKMI